MQIDRVELNRALAKAIAYKNVGNAEKLEQAAFTLLSEMLRNGLITIKQLKEVLGVI